VSPLREAVSGTLTVTNSTISGNTASTYYFSWGGGIYHTGSHEGSGTLMVTNSTISGNAASGSDSRGGGIYSSGGTLMVTNSTISGNTASDSTSSRGGGICSYSTLAVTNSTISGNSASGSSYWFLRRGNLQPQYVDGDKLHDFGQHRFWFFLFCRRRNLPQPIRYFDDTKLYPRQKHDTEWRGKCLDE